MLYRHFYRQKAIAFAGAGDGLGLRGSYSSASIVNDRQQPRLYFARVTLAARLRRLVPANRLTLRRVAPREESAISNFTPSAFPGSLTFNGIALSSRLLTND
jgi:hypothetical protein